MNDDEILADSGFFWREADGVKALVARRLEAAGFVNGFSTRGGGVSEFPKDSLNLAGFNEDARENIYENRRRFLRLFPAEMKIAAVYQCHGSAVKTIEADEDVTDSDTSADAMISRLKGVLLGVKTADCVPVLVADPASGAFAAIHAGWRGTVASIVANAVGKMQEKFGAEPNGMIAAIGPAASVRQYEIGEDVIEAFGKNFADAEKYFVPTRPGHARIDLHAANRDQLIDCGVDAANISIAPFCTMERTDLFFSYRREKQLYGKTGRLLSVIGRA
ncbi:MAG: multi-copper polyphenol oxidoreductase, laccase [Acidobacteria bacterium OLB17]|nr:MAG: multi-copper polyphenol oxidoreductase, laccase [Acidobacteria bacterium OLB17]MCZ2391059.1 peptidoglycan editing factor PgeF [Acidobacteriota bacterium]